ncbi:MAG: hypothetical protein ISR65_20500 [Bacteriovoracaceae bacterium]|nr:hypothetical protein [Bacteriovoracaceae bacterium]
MTGEIANFTDEQIFQYSLKRFTNIISQGKDESEVDAKDQEFVRDFATKETKQFFVEIKSLPSIYYLASNPLMLNVLIDQKTNKQLIPNGKYEILKMMIENLVFEQPKRRDKAAGVTRASILSDNYKRQLLSYIAYTAFNENQSGLYRKDYLIEKIESYLIDEKMGLGWENYRARLNSEEIFEQKSGQLGILLEKTPDLFGFFHRSLQEYLSSNYVNKMDLDDKLEILETHMLDSEWREILLAIVSEQTNGHEIGEIINFLEKQVYANSPGKFLSTLLLAHLIILNPNTSAGLCKKHFDTIFNEVQIGEDSSISNEVINLLVQGLNDSKLSLLIEEQINYWFPCETRWRTFLIESLESWSKLDQVEKLLLKSFFSEDNYNQRATAKTYSKVFSGDEEKGRNLFNTFINSSNDDVKAALAEAIVLGWNESDFFNELMEHCNKSDSKHVKLIGLYGKLNKDGPSNEILDELISFTSKRSSFFYAWKTLLSSMFTEFYSGDEKLKAVCLNSFNLRYDSRIETINSDIAMEVMLTNYPQDSDVANLIKDHLENKNSYLMHNHDNWRLLGQNFKDNEILKEPFVNWCKRKSSASNVEISLGAGVAPTEELKQIIIKMLDDYCPFWAADALIRYWPDDKDVIESIKRFAETNDSIKSNLAESLRHVYKDDKAVREMLVDLVKSNQTIRIDIVLRAINQIDNGHIKDDVIDLYFSRSINRAELINQAGIDVLINSRPDHQLVKAAGLEELMDSDGAHYAVSKSLNDDPEIRKKISMKFNPLNTPERLHLCNNIKTTGIPTELKLKFMSKYRNEVNPRIRTISCISYYSTLMEVSRVTDEKVQALKDDLFARGPEYESMRQSAFIGLTIINRYDVIIEAKSPYKDEESYTLPHNSIVKENPELYEYLVINWNAIECGLGSQLFAVINPGRNSTYLWSELSDYLHLNSMLHSRVIDELEQNGANLNLRLIKIWYNSNPNSSGLMNECMNFITNYKVNSYHRENDTYFPSWIIGAKFASPENLSILSELTSNDPMNTLGIFAIQVGWPQSEISKKLFDYYVDNNIGADYYILTQLISNHSSIDHFVAFVIKMAKNDIISKSRNKFWIKGPFSDRIKIDSEISGSIFKRILSNEDLNIKGLGFLMGLIRNQEIPQELVEWILEFEKNISSEDLLVTCYDYYSGRIKTFAQQLELLS